MLNVVLYSAGVLYPGDSDPLSDLYLIGFFVTTDKQCRAMTKVFCKFSRRLSCISKEDY